MADAIWKLDDGDIRGKAEKVQKENIEYLGHIDLDKVMFVTMSGAKAGWAGKCFHVRPPWDLLTLAPSLFGTKINKDIDIRYIIALNDSYIASIFADPKREEGIIAHELAHINKGMDGTVPHDVQDFSWRIQKYGYSEDTIPECSSDGIE